MIKVCIQGLGFVGAAMATAVSSKLDDNNRPLYDVVGIDLNTTEGKKRIDSINNGRFPFISNDKQLMHEIKRSFSRGNLKASSNNHHYEDADIVLISTNCDLVIKNGRNKINIKSFTDGIHILSKLIREDALIIVESTVPPGTCEKIIRPIFEKSFKLRKIDINKLGLAHSYERVMPGENYFNSIINYWRVFAGINNNSAARCKMFLDTVINTKEYPLMELKNTTASETAKVLENSYRAVNIAFIDEWSRFAEDVNIDLFEIIDAIRLRPTHQNIRQPGFGVGGYCLTKDPLFAKIAAKDILNKEGHKFFFSSNAVKINKNMPLASLQKLRSHFNHKISGKHILLMGVTYREDIGDTRYSPSETFANNAISEGFLVDAYDPLVSNWPELEKVNFKNQLPKTDIYDAIIFAVAHKDFKDIDFENWIRNKNTLILDSNNVLSEDQRINISINNYNFISIGRG